ncbi:hypothetical protein [Microbispora sp. H11081]|uniref:hypothetical protein n=1 Tax=Microbispora sp. H11081 TaxID=2729107 RepID=UPI0014763A76|nr:hypothetical protein [Microbispora sp. H11081]
MPGAPFSVRLRPIAAVLLLGLVTSTACTSDDSPTAAQAGQTLKKHVLQLLKERNAQNVSITDPGGRNIPCGDGKAKQTFAAVGEDNWPGTEPAALNDMLVGALKRVGDYEISETSGAQSPVVVINRSTHTILRLSSSEKGLYQVQGETQCLFIS